MRRGALLLLVLALGLSGTACQTTGSNSEGPVAATLDGKPIRVGEVDDFIKDELFARETRGGNPSRLHKLRKDALDRLLAQRVVEREAERRGVTPEELIRAEGEKQEPITDADVAAFYEKNKDQLHGTPLEQVADRIRQHLEIQRGQRVVKALVDAADVKVLLETPRVEVAADGPSRGPAEAPVTIIEFSDFQCPYCRRARPILQEVLKRHPDAVRLVYRHFPLESIHPRARASAEAAECARDQGAFWEYHDRLFDNQRALEDADLIRYAGEVGLDVDRFKECVGSHRFADRVDADAAAARKAGITGTPSLVVNGVLLTGLQSADALDEVVRDELPKT